MKKIFFCFLLIFRLTSALANDTEIFQEIIEIELNNTQFYENLETCISLSELDIDFDKYSRPIRFATYQKLIKKYSSVDKKKKGLSYLLGIEYLHSKDKALALETFLALRNSYSDNKTKSEMLFWIGLSYFRQSDYNNAIKFLEECLATSEDANNFDKLIKSNYYLGLANFRINEKHKSIEYFTNSLEVSKQRENARWVVPCYRKLGICYKNINQYDRALEQYNLGLEYGAKHGYKNQEDLLLLNIGNLYRAAGDFDKALLNYQYSYNLREKKNDTEPMAVCLRNIGAIYEILGEYKKSQQFYEKAYNITKKDEPLNKRAIGYKMEIGKMLMLNKQTEKADSILQSCLIDFKEYGSVQEQITCSFYIGKNYLLSNRLQKALNYFKKAKSIIGDDDAAMNTMIDAGIANVHMQQKDFNKTIDICVSLLDNKLKDEANKVDVLPVLTMLSDAYAATGNYKKALGITNRRAKLEKEIFDENKMREIGKFEMRTSMKSHLDEKEKSIKLLQIENENHQLNISKKNQQTTIVLVLLITSLIILGLMYLFLSKNKQKNIKLYKLNEKLNNSLQIIKGQKEKLSTTIIELETNETKIKQTNQRLELILERREKVIERLQRFGAILAHDFKEPVRTIVSFSKLLNRTVRPKINDREIEFLDFVTSSTQRLNNMVDKLYAYSNNTLALMNKFQMINLETIISNVQEDLTSKIKNKQAVIELKPISHSILGDEVLIYQLFQNLISNALKYSKDDTPPKIKIENEVSDGYLIVSISDNGVGIEKKSSVNIFALFSRTTNTSDKEGHGLGLATCKEVLEIHGGKIDYDSEIGVGTTFHLYFKEFQKVEKL